MIFLQAWILKAILSFTEDLSQPVEVGLMLALFAFLAQLTRNLTFNGLWMMGIHTGTLIFLEDQQSKEYIVLKLINNICKCRNAN